MTLKGGSGSRVIIPYPQYNVPSSYCYLFCVGLDGDSGAWSHEECLCPSLWQYFCLHWHARGNERRSACYSMRLPDLHQFADDKPKCIKFGSASGSASNKNQNPDSHQGDKSNPVMRNHNTGQNRWQKLRVGASEYFCLAKALWTGTYTRLLPLPPPQKERFHTVTRVSGSVSDPDPDWIWIQSGQRIWIRNPEQDPDPGGQNDPKK